MKKIEFILCLSCMFLLVFYVVKTEAHPDGATPYWYPSSFIYGYVVGWLISRTKPTTIYTRDVDQVRSVCGCVVDALRHSLTYQEITDNDTKASAQLIVNATFPLCIQQELNR